MVGFCLFLVSGKALREFSVFFGKTADFFIFLRRSGSFLGILLSKTSVRVCVGGGG